MFFQSIPRILLLGFGLSITAVGVAQPASPSFRVIGFYTARNDQAHISFVHEANRWFAAQGREHGFQYDSSKNWSNLNPEILSRYEVVIFLDSRPDSLPQRLAFQNYMEHGGAWVGFHFSGFALTPSDFPQNWDWYHNVFLGSGSYRSNTWRPTSAILKVEVPGHPVMRSLPARFRSSPNEWYRWTGDLRGNPDIKVLLSVDSASFPLGTGPKQHEIWHGGDYPVAWTHRKYHMVYFNMGHNDIDYEHHSNQELSLTFGNTIQDQLILNTLMWLGKRKQK